VGVVTGLLLAQEDAGISGERGEWYGDGECVGILRFAQDDSKNRQGQDERYNGKNGQRQERTTDNGNSNSNSNRE
jgi:hypothetical protein